MENREVALDHGIAHMNRVANNTYKLLKEYNINYDTCKLGYIAGLIDNIKDIQEIVTAIKNHGNGGKNPNEIT